MNNLQSLSLNPAYIAPSAWWQHVPIAHWLVCELRPQKIVELGTHYGVSFFSFCEAAQAFSPDTFVYAVDTWEGDEHSGHYEEDVYAQLFDHWSHVHRLRSRLIRSTFDDAAQYFEANSIDLLHIDGLHTYEAVKHDYDLWSPKMKQDSLILFHDINVRERGFGVWKLWDEIKSVNRTYEVANGHGLGILVRGEAMAAKLEAFSTVLSSLTAKGVLLEKLAVLTPGGSFGLPPKTELERIKAMVEEVQLEASQAKAEAEEYKGKLEQFKAEATQVRADASQAKTEAERFKATLKHFEAEASQAKAKAEKFKATLEQFEAEASEAKAETLVAQAHAQSAHSEAEELRTANQGLLEQLHEKGKALDSLKAELIAATNQYQHINFLHTEIVNSRSWRLGHGPRRRLADFVKASLFRPGWLRKAQGDPVSSATWIGNFYRSDALIPFSLKRQFKEAVYDNFGGLLAGLPSYQLYLQHKGKPTVQIKTPEAADAWTLEQYRSIFSSQAELEYDLFLQGDQYLTFPESVDAPITTAIVVLHNKAALTFRCLQSLSRQLGVDLKLIIVDNASTDSTDLLLSRLKGSVTIIRNSENLHFLRACNQAFSNVCEHSQSVSLINNDAVLEPMALHNAMQTLERFPSVGAVTGMISHPDGRLQEAGSVIFNDASCRGVGRRSDPMYPLWNIRRPVDYGSGCLMIIRSEVLAQLKGFDEAYAPAYYEETDLSLRIQDLGMQVLYEPSCRATHVEFASSKGGFDAVRPLMESHRLLLLRKHARRLKRHLDGATFIETDPRHLLLNHSENIRILWIDDQPPRANLGSGFGRLECILKSLADGGCWLTLFATNGLMGPFDQRLSSDYELLAGGSEELSELLAERSGFYTHICASRRHNILLLTDLVESLGQPRPLVVADIESLFSIRDWSRDYFKATGQVLEKVEPGSVPGLQAEIESLSHFDQLLVVSEGERRLIAEGTRHPTWCVGHRFKLVEPAATFAGGRGVCFLGSILDPAAPNLDSLHWLLDEILPKFIQLPGCADYPITIAGHHDSSLVKPLYEEFHKRFPSVNCVGFVKDVSRLMLDHSIFIAPTRFAAGLPHKVHQAAAHGLPIVTTPLIASQMGWVPDQDILTAQTGPDFALAMARLIHDPTLWNTIASGGRLRVSEECDPKSLVEALQHAFQFSGRLKAVSAGFKSH